jgi:2',3'-cyclic-nucleotide 2'-phosphodiesterase
MGKKSLRAIFFGDVVGEPGIAMFERWAPRLKEKYKSDFLVVNGENTAKNGRGITPGTLKSLQDAGANVITSGNHVWANKTIVGTFDDYKALLRPANYPSGCPGKGYSLVNVNDVVVAVVNIQGRVFMHEDLECPFRAIESLLTLLKSKTNIIFVDFHAEATSEKQAMRYFLDGKVSGIYGTHTHVQTADEQISEKGTSYITDLGFAGAKNSALGLDPSIIVERFIRQMPVQFKVEKRGPMIMNGIFVEVDVETGRSLHIERISVVDEEIDALLT